MKKLFLVRTAITFIVLTITLNGIALGAEKHFVANSIDEVDFCFGGSGGGISIQVSSQNYNYSFGMLAKEFSGHFSGDSLGFINQSQFVDGKTASTTQTIHGSFSQTMTSAGEAQITESLNIVGAEKSPISVAITLFGDNLSLEINKPALPSRRPEMPLKTGYLRDEEGNIIGGYFQNISDTPFQGKISFVVGLSYNIGWQAESVTYFLKGQSDITVVIEPRDKLFIRFLANPRGGITCFFPDIIWQDKPLSFSAQKPDANSSAVAQFKEMIETIWTGYKDPEPDKDYLNIKIELKETDRTTISKTIGFYFPIEPYFTPPR